MGGDCGGVSGLSAGAGPVGHTGMCLLGMGIGHAADVLMWSRLRVEGRGDKDRMCSTIGRGERAIVAIVNVKEWCGDELQCFVYTELFSWR